MEQWITDRVGSGGFHAPTGRVGSGPDPTRPNLNREVLDPTRDQPCYIFSRRVGGVSDVWEGWTKFPIGWRTCYSLFLPNSLVVSGRGPDEPFLLYLHNSTETSFQLFTRGCPQQGGGGALAEFSAGGQTLPTFSGSLFTGPRVRKFPDTSRQNSI